MYVPGMLSAEWMLECVKWNYTPLSFTLDCFNLSALLHWLLLNSSFIHRGAQWFLVGVGVCLPDLLHILFLEFVFKRSPYPQLRAGISLIVSAIFK